jgi:hypothetical protein
VAESRLDEHLGIPDDGADLPFSGGRADGQVSHLVAMPGQRLLPLATNWDPLQSFRHRIRLPQSGHHQMPPF